MIIGQMQEQLALEELWRCDSMPSGRALYHPLGGGLVYLKVDGSQEPFDLRIDGEKYLSDDTWRKLGTAPRQFPGIGMDLPRLKELLAGVVGYGV